jgi:hypothetical protein
MMEPDEFQTFDTREVVADVDADLGVGLAIQDDAGAGRAGMPLARADGDPQIVRGVGDGAFDLHHRIRCGQEGSVVIGDPDLQPVLGNEIALAVGFPRLERVVGPGDGIGFGGVRRRRRRLHRHLRRRVA